MSVVAALRPPPLQPSHEGHIRLESKITGEQRIHRKGSESGGGGVVVVGVMVGVVVGLVVVEVDGRF